MSVGVWFVVVAAVSFAGLMVAVFWPVGRPTNKCPQCGMPHCKAGSLPHVAGNP